MSDPKRFILVHGAGHGSWCWQKLIPFLEELGHSVLAVDLPGRQGKGQPGWRLSLQDYVDDLAARVDQEQGKVVLVGHSLGGMSISAVAEKLPHKIERLIYLTAWVSSQGKNLAELGKHNPGSKLHSATSLSLLRGVVTINMRQFKECFCADCRDDDVTWASENLLPESLRTAFGRIHLTQERFGSVPTSYVRCANDQALTLALQQQMLESIGCQDVHTLPSSHSAFLSMPLQLAQVLDAAVSGVGQNK
jgi:pimeloyl-ACP methyl ester carboxylesterase